MRHDVHFVEELAGGAETVGQMIALTRIHADPDQPRTSMGDLSSLVQSIRDKGVLEPVLVRPWPDLLGDEERYRLISGDRRYRAAEEAGLVEIPAIVMEVSEEEALEIALVENLQRKDLTPFEEADGYRALGERFDYTHQQIADAVGKSRSLVTETLALVQVPARAREAAQALEIASKSLLLEIFKAARDEEEMVRLLEESAGRGLSRDDLRRRSRARQAARRGSRRKPHVFKFQSPDKTYSLALSFRRSTVDRGDLISALESVLEQLRSETP
ncbi:MAG: ParB/RepB/Spo0J family partition protein [Thermoanaerobaculia bacterium]|nr:ParB/RepB/Spo0J family partition protein [Thermoanaerobaculia bacterium]